MTNFIRDNTSLLPAKSNWTTDPLVPADQKVAAVDWNEIRQAVLDIQSYLRGAMDASASISTPGSLAVAATATVQHLDVKNDANNTVGAELDLVGYNGRWFCGIDVANATTSRDFVIAGRRGSYSFEDGVTTNGSPTITSAAQGGFSAALVGKAISGPGIPLGATVLAVGSATSLTMSANATASATVRITITDASATDVLYMKHRGSLGSTLGLGVTPPDGSARLQVSAHDAEPAMGTVRLRRGPAQTGNVLAIHDSTPADKFWIDKDYFISGAHGFGGAICIQADAANGRALMLCDNAKGSVFSFEYPGGNALRLKYVTGGTVIVDFESNGGFRHQSSRLGFYGAATTTKPTVTGSRGGNAALASLLTALANLGLITDSTTA